METTKNEQELNITNISEAETNINNLYNTSKKYVIDMKEKKDFQAKMVAECLSQDERQKFTGALKGHLMHACPSLPRERCRPSLQATHTPPQQL